MAVFAVFIMALILSVHAQQVGEERKAELEKVTKIATVNSGVRGFI